MIRRILTTFLVVCLVLATVQLQRPAQARAVEPITIGIVLSAAAIAAIIAVAGTYAVSPTFQDACQEAGATIQEALVVQNMIDHVATYASGNADFMLYNSDFRLLKAAIAFIKVSGAWGKVQEAAAGATEWAGDWYYDVSDIWASFGFATGGAVPAFPTTPEGWGSGAAAGLSLPLVQDIGGGSYTEGQRSVIALAMHAIAVDPGYHIKTAAGGAIALLGVVPNQYYRWYAFPAGTALEDAHLWCAVCEEYEPQTAFIVGASGMRISWTPGAEGVYGLAEATGLWLAQHGVYDHVPPAPVDTLPTTFPGDVTAPTILSTPSDIVDAIPGATTLPVYPGQGMVPPYVPPAEWEWGNTGSTTGDTALGEIAEGIGEYADTLTDIATGLSNTIDGVPAGFSHLLEWLFTPVQAFLNGLAALLTGVAAVVGWLAQAWVMAEAFVWKLFNPNPQQLQFKFEPRWDNLKNKLKLVWPFAAFLVASALFDTFTGGGGGGLPMTYSFTLVGHTYTVDAGAGFEYIDPYRWILASMVWLYFLMALIQLFRPQVTY